MAQAFDRSRPATTGDGRFEIYLTPFPGGGAKHQVSTAGGSRPRWSGDGRELYFTSADCSMMAAEIRLTSNGADIGPVRALFKLPSGGCSTMLPAMAGGFSYRRRVWKPVPRSR